MEETGRGRDQPLVAHDEAPNVSQLGKSPFHDPPASVAAQCTPVLRGRMCGVAPGGDDRRNAPVGQPSAQRVAVTTPIGQQALRAFARASRRPRTADRNRVEGLLAARDLRWGRRLQGLLPAENPCHRPEPSTSCPGPACWYRLGAPLWSRGQRCHRQRIRPRGVCVGPFLWLSNVVCKTAFPGVFELTNRVCGGLVHLYARCAGGSGGPRRHTPDAGVLRLRQTRDAGTGQAPAAAAQRAPPVPGSGVARRSGSRLRRSGPGRP
jgi:hypothetical protein